MNLIRAIELAHKGRVEKIITENFKGGAVWNREKDKEWHEYINAMVIISNYPKLERLLEKIRYI